MSQDNQNMSFTNSSSALTLKAGDIRKVMAFLLSYLFPQSTALVLAILILVQLRRKLNVPPVYYSAEAKAGNYASLGENGEVEWCHRTNWIFSWSLCRQTQRKHNTSMGLVNRSLAECMGDVLNPILLSGARNDNGDGLLWISCLPWVLFINYTDLSVMKFEVFVSRWCGNRRGAIGIRCTFCFIVCVFYALSCCVSL